VVVEVMEKELVHLDCGPALRTDVNLGIYQTITKPPTTPTPDTIPFTGKRLDIPLPIDTSHTFNKSIHTQFSTRPNLVNTATTTTTTTTTTGWERAPYETCTADIELASG
jgi:hypothetical protein